MNGNPVVVMVDEERAVVYHAFRYEKNTKDC